MSKKKRGIPPLFHGAAYGLLRSIIAAMGSAKISDMLSMSRAVGRTFAGASINRKRLQRGIDNLTIAFPHWTPDQRHDYAVRAYEHLFMLAVETGYITRYLTDDGWVGRVELGNLGRGLNVLLQGRRAVMITGHCGNWELLGYALSVVGFPIHALYRPLDLEPLDNWLRRTRERRGLVLVDKFNAGEDLPGIMESGGTPGFVADQNAGERGLFVPFFNRLASAYKSIGLLALKYDAAVICGVARRCTLGATPLGDQHVYAGENGPAFVPPDALAEPLRDEGPAEIKVPLTDACGLHYRMEISDIIYPEEARAQPDPLFYITARYRRAIEQMVRRAPEQYLWMHRYWKSRPRHERENRPFPSSLRAKLEQLPWMTQADLNAILEHSKEDAAAEAASAKRAPAPAQAAQTA